ncbi:peptidase domain-containing ABC transporter [Asaia siamensis]|uniref:Toxin transporter n=1 Tax=Asaia siamensis TaxID=110479 RepID=A0ABQ1M7T5_9PROT|nr:peptidase domain-containing ABC transporter [Asaia siamensis]GBR06100.1 bacteriocin/lantibiotic exporter permease [Asaia siamensis NRIC 0323]GGC35155.1 toxin transporter [Asaia siamensis]
MKALNALEFGFQPKTPVILQVEAAECGMACLAMIMGHHGNRIDLPTLRRRFSLSIKGSTLKDLMATAERVGLATRAVRLDLDELSSLRLPCILHWNLNHFVVLTKVSGTKATIHDPAFGRRVLGLDVVSRDFTGIALEAFPNENFRKEDDRETLRLRDLFRHVSGLRSSLLMLGILSLGLEAIAIVMPMVSQVIIDEVVVTSDHELLSTIAAGVALLLFLQLVIACVRQWSVLILGTRVGLQWNAGLFNHLSRLPLDYFAKRHVGDILSRFNAIASIQKTMTTDMVQTIMDGLMAIGMGIMLFIYGGWLGAVALAAVALDVCLRLFTYRLYREANEEQIVFDARQQSHFIETLRGMASVKLLGLRERRRTSWLNLIIDSINVRLRIQRYDLIYGRLAEMIFGADRLIMMVLGALAVMKGAMTVGMLVAFLSYKDQFAGRIGSLISSAFQIRMLSVQTERLSDIVMTEIEPCEAAPVLAAETPDAIRGALTCTGLSARYGAHDPWIFQNVSLDVPAGRIVAIVGPSGCGKTTFLKALMGLMEVSDGQIALDGHDIAALTLEGYRNRIAGVLQDDGLFSGSIAENISGFAEDPDESWVRQCAAHAAILQDIDRMPMGFDTLIGDMGAGLSGGQKQRLILARALYRKPDILFLDEATSHLDEMTEAQVAAALREMKITQIIVAHRPATIAHADRIYVFQPGGALQEYIPQGRSA